MSEAPQNSGQPDEYPLEEMIQSLVAGDLDEAGRSELCRRLTDDPAARETYGSMIELEAMLHREFPRLPEFREPAPMARRPRRRAGWTFFPGDPEGVSPAVWVGGIAAAVALMFAGWWILKPDFRPVVVEAYGEWSWMDGAGHRQPLGIGARLPSTGSLVVQGTGAFAKLRFPDASTAVLSGGGELRVPAEKSKRLLLEAGNLEVEMSPQPEGRPASIETATARVEVVGTRFTVDATDGSTTVAVSEGKVKLKRLADGNTVEIPSDRIATASLDSGSQLETRAFSKAPVDWSARSPDGRWFEAKAFRAGGTAAQPIIHHGVTFQKEGSGVLDGLVALKPQSRIRVKFRVADPDAILRVFLVCRTGKAMFAGNRQEEFRVSAIAPDAAGWRVFESEIEAMDMLTPKEGFGLPDLRLTNLTISVLDAGDRLEISEVEIGG